VHKRINKLSLGGMELPSKYKKNFDFEDERPSLETSKLSLGPV
jgi:hypothetical protein